MFLRQISQFRPIEVSQFRYSPLGTKQRWGKRNNNFFGLGWGGRQIN